MSTSRFGTPSASRGRIIGRLAAVLLLGVAAVTCTRDLVEPGRVARLALAPGFAPGAAPGGSALGVDQIRAQLRRHSTQEVVLDKTYPFATGSSLQLDLTLPLKQATDTFDVDLDYEHGAEVLFSGSQSAVAGAGAPNTPISVLVSYVGPGTGATSLTIAPRDTTITSGDSLQLRLTVLDTATPDSVYVGWGSNNAGQPVAATGRLVASLVRGTVTIRAVSPTPPGLRDSTTVTIVPKPAALIKVSGDGQTGVSGQSLPQPLVVQVNGSDLLGVPGVSVTFSVVSGGGSVDSATVVTDSLGRAGTGVTLGASGAQSFKAAAGTFSVTFGETGGAAPPKTWTGAVSTDWATAGNWNPSGVPAATDSVIIPSGTTNSPIMHGGASYPVDGLSINAGATVTIDTASLIVFGSFTQAGTFTDPTGSSALELQGSGKTLAGSIPILSTTVSGTYVLTGNVQASTLQVLGALTLGGHTLSTSTAFGTGGSGVVVMNAANDTLYAQGTMSFAGGATQGDLNAGTIIVSGNFVVSAPGAFHAGQGVTTVFNGTTPQTLLVTDSTASGGFDAIDFRNPAGVQIPEIIFSGGSVTLEAGAVVTTPDTSFTGQGLVVGQNVTTLAGSRLHIGRLYIGQVLSPAAGTYAVTSTIFTGGGQVVPAGPTYPFLYTTGSVTVGSGVTVVNQLAVQGGQLVMNGNFSFPGNTFVQFGGMLVMNAHTFSMGGDLTVNNNGLISMQNQLDTLIVGGNAFFEGGSEAGRLTAGGIIFRGNFTEGSGDPQAFASTGTSTAFVNGGSAQTITFGHAGAAGASHFYDLGVGNPQGALGIGSDVYILGHGAFLPGAPKIVSGSGQVVHFANLSITGVTFNNVAIAYDAGLGGNNLIALDTITFENYNVNSATPLITIVSPGNSLGGPFFFNNMVFDTDITANGGSGLYLKVTDSSGTGALIIDIASGLVVTEGEAHTVMAGGATVNWSQP